MIPGSLEKSTGWDRANRFGEIGVLQRRPRTATVTVTDPVELVRVPGAVFLDGLAAPEILPDPIRRTVAARLARTHPAEVT